MPRLIFCRKNAQMGNRLVVYAHLLAAARERGWDLTNPTFEEYADGFVGTLPRPHGRAYFPVRVAWQLGKLGAPLAGGLLATARARGAVTVDLKAALDQAEAHRAQVLLVQGFAVRHAPYVERQAAWLRAFFRPIDAHRLPAEGCVADLRSPGVTVVGIHVRQGDYAQHLGGRFFYAHAQYAGFMRRIRDLLAPGQVRFLVCSQAPVPRAEFADLDWRPGPGSAVADMHALSLTDLILGPPSSFSVWAAFTGGNRLLALEAWDQPFTLADFVPVTAPEVKF
jgi:hypothetical protein